jgi:hypothetical protein
MIDKNAFSAGMGLLAANFNKTVDPALSRIWYGTLSQRLTTEQFEQAVQLSIANDDFWPTAAALVAKVAPPSLESRGLAALEHVNRVVNSVGGFRYLPHDRFVSEFDAPTRAAISACGGLREMANVSEERYAALTRKFATAYAKSLEAPVALPATGTDNRVTGLVRGVSRALALVDYKNRAAGEGVEP